MSLLSLFLKPTHNLHTLTNTPIIRDNNIRKKLFLLLSIGSLENNKFENRFHFVPSYPVLHQREVKTRAKRFSGRRPTMMLLLLTWDERGTSGETTL